MKNIKSFYMKNFQSHKDTNIVLSPNITSFVGESGKGKTAMFRLLKLVIKNQPNGDKYITAGESKMVGGVVLEDDIEVVRERSKSINRYTIHRPDGTSLPLEKFGTKIPPDVIEALGYEAIKIDTDLSIDLNFAEQLEGPFLFSENDASKAKTIDGLARINVFNVALRNTNKVISNYNVEMKNYQRQIAEVDSKLEQYEGLDKMGEDIDRLGELLAQIEALQSKKEMYEGFINRQEEIRLRTEESKSEIERLKPILTIENTIRDLTTSLQLKNLYVSLHSTHSRIGKEIEAAKTVISHKESILGAEKRLHEVEQALQTQERYLSWVQKRGEIMENISKGEAYISRLSDIRNVEGMLAQLKDTIGKEHTLTQLNLQLVTNGQQLTLIQQIISRLGQIRTAEQMLEEVLLLVKQRDTLVGLKSSLNECRQTIAKGEAYKSELTSKIETDKEAYAILLKQFNKCPVCFGELDESHIHQVMASL